MSSGFFSTIRALGQRKMFFLFLCGLASGLPFALTLGTLQAWMKESGVDLKTIGLFAFLRLPFSLKFLWAPLMDRFAFGFLDRRRSWALMMQILVIVCIVGMSLTDPQTQVTTLLLWTLGLNIFAASQDIVLDAYRREILEDQELGLGVGVFVNGYIVAFRYISGALALLLPMYVGGWSNVYLMMAGIMGALAIGTMFAPKIKSAAVQQPKTLHEAFVGPLKEYFARPEALTVLAFIVLYKVGDTMAGTMTLPFILEAGFSKEEYVAIVKVLGPLATVVGVMVGGHYVLKLGIRRSLWIMGFFQAVSTMAFALLSWTGKNNGALIGIVGFENFTAQMGTAAYAAYMGSITNVRFTATQYALLSSLMAVPGAVFAARTGAMAEGLGWPMFFMVCGLVAAPGIFLIPLLGGDQQGDASWKGVARKGLIGVTLAALVYAVVSSTGDLWKLFVN